MDYRILKRRRLADNFSDLHAFKKCRPLLHRDKRDADATTPCALIMDLDVFHL